MAEMDAYPVFFEEVIEQNPDLLALSDGIRGDESNADIRALNVLASLHIPIADVIKNTVSLDVLQDELLVGLLLVRLPCVADKRRVAENVGAFRNGKNACPVDPQGIAVPDRGAFGQWQPHEIHPEGGGNHLVHLVVNQPHGDFGNACREFAVLNPIHGIDIDHREVADIDHTLVAVKGFEDFQLQQP